MSKYRNKKTQIGDELFDSKKEASRWSDLLLLQRAGEIRDLTRQVRLPLEIDGEKVCTYVCDFKYRARDQGWAIPERAPWVTIYEDVKGTRTPVYLLKKKLVKALLKINILET